MDLNSKLLHLQSMEDCITKAKNTVYDLMIDNYYGFEKHDDEVLLSNIENTIYSLAEVLRNTNSINPDLYKSTLGEGISDIVIMKIIKVSYPVTSVFDIKQIEDVDLYTKIKDVIEDYYGSKKEKTK